MPDPTGKVAGDAATPARPAANATSVTVTYDGPTDPKDHTAAVTVPHTRPRHDEYFALGQQIQTSQSTADRLAAMAGHTFTIKPATPPEGDTHASQ